MYIPTHIHTHIHTYIHTYAYTHIHTQVPFKLNLTTNNIHTYTHTRTYTHTHTHTKYTNKSLSLINLNENIKLHWRSYSIQHFFRPNSAEVQRSNQNGTWIKEHDIWRKIESSESTNIDIQTLKRRYDNSLQDYERLVSQIMLPKTDYTSWKNRKNQ